MKLVALLHGYGASGSDLRGLTMPWAGMDRQFVTTNAPNPCAGMGPGYEWFSLDGWMPGTSFDPFVPRIGAAADALKVQLKAELAKKGLSWKDLVIMGFSQGAIMAFAVALSEPEACAGIMAYSGAYLTPIPPKCKPPVLLVHGGADMVVTSDAYYQAKMALEKAAVPLEDHFFPHCGHWIDPQGLAAGANFLHKLD
mgnify:CR=1 FL=1